MEIYPAIENNFCAPIEALDKVEVRPTAHLPPRHTGARNNYRSVAPKTGNQAYNGKNSRANDRSKSNRRRFYSNDGSRRRQGSHQRILQQPYGWYEVDKIGRNQSLEPRLPICEPVIVGKNSKRNKKRRNRRHSQRPNDSQSTYVPNTFKSTVSLLRELPFARLHYNSFRRLFPNLPNRTVKEKKFCLDASKEMPFSNCTDNQLEYIWKDASVSDLFSVTNDPGVCSWQKSGGPDKESIAWLPEPSNQMLGDTECDSETNVGDEDTNLATTMCDLTEAGGYGEEEDEAKSLQTNTNLEHDASDSISRDEVSTLSGSATSKALPPPLKDKVGGEESNFDSLPYIDMDGDVSAILNSKASTNLESERSINKLSLKIQPISGQSPKNMDSNELGIRPPSIHRTNTSTKTAVKPQFPRSCVCYACAEIAYPAERVETDDKVFHIGCFRCHRCSSMLHRGGWNQRGLNYYCNPCHRRLALQTLRH